MTARAHLEAIFRAERELREAEARLLGTDEAALPDLLAGAVEEAKKLEDERESATRLERLADLCAQVPGPKAADTIIAILDSEDPGVRVAAGEALLDLGFDRYAEVARAVERRLETGTPGPALTELPWVLTEIAEPSALKLVGRFLELKEGDAVASAIEALAALGDPDGAKMLKKLVKDTREVTLEEDGEESTATIGQLALEAIDQLDPDME